MFKLKHFPVWALSSFVFLSLLGVILRAMVLYPIPALNYIFLLHAHSHFAFAGWIFLALVLLLVRPLAPGSCSSFRTILILTLVSAFGMLISFSLQGYKFISISFSTLFILVNYWFSYKLWKQQQLNHHYNPLSAKLIRASLIFLCISSIGPFTLGPIIAAGLKGSPLYNNAIYFYLHFHMNGWMFMSVLALVFNRTQFRSSSLQNKALHTCLNTFILSTVPLYFIFTLWSNSNDILRGLALIGSIINMISWFLIWAMIKKSLTKSSLLTRAALLAFSLKVLFQPLVCHPDIGSWAFSNRNLIIGYIHLLTLGGIMPIALSEMNRYGFFRTKWIDTLNKAFILTVVLYVALLFLQPALAYFSILIPHYHFILLIISLVFLLVGILYLISCFTPGNQIKKGFNSTPKNLSCLTAKES